MTEAYALSRVKDALEKSGNNHLKAQRLLLSWIENDHTLLFGLIAPHMQSIVTHAINHAATPKKILVKKPETGEFGGAMLAGVKARDAAAFGEAETRDVPKPGKASKAHIDAITTIANASKKKPKK